MPPQNFLHVCARISTHVGVFHKYRCQHRWEPVTSTDVNPAEADRIAGKEQKPSTSGIPETSMPKQIDAEQHHPIDCIVYDSPTNEDSSESCDEPELQELLLVRDSSFLNALKVARTHAHRQRARARACTHARTHARNAYPRTRRLTGGELRRCVVAHRG